jgi:hypothetical protein
MIAVMEQLMMVTDDLRRAIEIHARLEERCRHYESEHQSKDDFLYLVATELIRGGDLDAIEEAFVKVAEADRAAFGA